MRKDVNGAKPKAPKGCLIPVLVFVGILLVGLIVGVSVGVSSSKDSLPPKSMLAETMDLTEQQEQAMQKIFDACGIVELKEVTLFQEGEHSTSYHVNDDETEHYKGADNAIVVWVDNETKTVQEIFFSGHDIYKDGTVLAQVPQFYVSAEQRDSYRAAAQMLVNQCLSYPDSAKYEGAHGWSYGVSDDGYAVLKSTVRAKNAFGMEGSHSFQVLFDVTTGTAVSLLIDGTEYLK